MPSPRDRVFQNVKRYGWHYYWISGGPTPSWAYTIGLNSTEPMPELVMAGPSFFTRDEVGDGVRTLVERASAGPPSTGNTWSVEPLGLIGFRPVHATWVEHLLLGASDFYGDRAFRAMQAVPEMNRTIDTPDLSAPFDGRKELPWRWLVDPWPFPIQATTAVFTDTEALQGNAITMVVRDTDDASYSPWQAFATTLNDIPTEIGRLVPFGTLLAVDPTLAEVLTLAPGEYAARDFIGDPWRTYAKVIEQS